MDKDETMTEPLAETSKARDEMMVDPLTKTSMTKDANVLKEL